MARNNGITINILTHEQRITVHILHFDIVIRRLISRYYMVKRSFETVPFFIKLTVIYSYKVLITNIVVQWINSGLKIESIVVVMIG